MKYIVYYLRERDFSENDMYLATQILLEEVEGESRFDTKEEAIEKARYLINKHTEVTILEVYCA